MLATASDRSSGYQRSYLDALGYERWISGFDQWDISVLRHGDYLTSNTKLHFLLLAS